MDIGPRPRDKIRAPSLGRSCCQLWPGRAEPSMKKAYNGKANTLPTRAVHPSTCEQSLDVPHVHVGLFTDLTGCKLTDSG